MDIEEMRILLTADVSQHNTAIDEALKKLSGLALEVKSTKQQHEHLDEQISKTAKQINDYGIKCDATRQKIASKNKQIQEAIQKHGEDSAQVAKLREQLSRLETTLQNQTNTLKKSNDQAAKLGAQLATVKEKENNLASQVSNTNKTFDKQQNEFAQTAKQGQSMGNQLQSTFLMLKGLAVGYAGKTLFNALIGSNVDFEQSMVQFEVMLQSADKAQKLMDDMTQFAAKTPLQLTDVKNAGTLLLNYGVEADGLIETLGRLGDLSLGNAEKLNRVSLAYGQMLAKGKVTGEELRQMTEAGIPLTQALADVMGIATSEMSKLLEKGQVGIPDLNKAIEQMTNEGGKFYNMMEKESKTLGGMWSTLKDNANITFREMGEGAFETLKSEASQLLETINAMSESGQLADMAQDWGEDIANVVVTVTKFIEMIYEMRTALMAGATGIIAYKIAVTSITAINTAVATLSGLKNMVELITTAKKAGASASLIYKAVILGEKAAETELAAATGITITTENGAKVAKMASTAATTASATATKGATAATWSWNAVLAANPLGLVAVAIGLVTTAIVGFNMASEQAKQQAEQSRQEAVQSSNEYKQQSENIDKLIQKYTELSNVTNLNEDAKKELKSIQDQLNEAFGDEGNNLDLVNGKYDEQIEKIKSMSAEKAKSKDREIYSEYALAKGSFTKDRSIDGTAGVVGDSVAQLDFYEKELSRLEQLKLEKGELTRADENYYKSLSIRYSEFKKQADEEIKIINARIDIAVLAGNMTVEQAEQEKIAIAGSIEAWNELIGMKNADANATSISGNATIKTAEDQVKAMEKVKSNLSNVQSALNELNSNKKISIDTMESLISTYPELLDCLDDEKALHDALIKKEAEEKDKYITGLQDKYVNTVLFGDNVSAANKALIDNLAKAYEVDGKNFKSMADIKLEIDNLLLHTLGENWSQYYGSQAEALRGFVNNMNTMVGPLTPYQSEALAKANAMLSTIDAAEKAASSYSPKTVSLGSKSSGGSTGKSSSNNSKDDSAKKEQDRIKGLFENAERYRQMGWISEQKYWEEVTTLRDQFYKKDSDEWWSWTLKIQKNNEDTHKKILDDIESAHEDYLSESQSYIDKCNENGWGTDNEVDAYKRRGDKIRQYQADLIANEQLTADERNELWKTANDDLYENDQLLKQSLLNQRNNRIENSESWIEERNYYNDWDKYSDTEVAARERIRANNKKDFESGDINWDTYAESDKQSDRDIRSAKGKEFDAWEKSADTYKNQRDKLGDWDKFGDSEVDFTQRKLQRLEEYYAQEAMGYQEYADLKLQYTMEMWDAVGSATDDALSDGMEKYEELKKQLADIEQKTQETWKRDDRLSDIKDTKSRMSEFEGAVTSAGQNEYKKLQEDLKKFQREEELYTLQQKNSAILEDYQSKWEKLEDLKTTDRAKLLNHTTLMQDSINSLLALFAQSVASQQTIAQNITNNYTNNNNVTQNNTIKDPVAAKVVMDGVGGDGMNGGA